jgi:hypothetical protein
MMYLLKPIDVLLLKPRHPLSFRSRGFDVFAGTCCLFPPVLTFTRLRTFRRKGVNKHGPVKLSGIRGNLFSV